MMLTQPPTAFAEHLDVTLRNPATLEPTGTIFTKHTFDDGQAIPAHSHMGDTVSVVISGEVAWTLSTGETIVAKPGQVVQIPGHEVYSLKANGKSQILTTCIFYW